MSRPLRSIRFQERHAEEFDSANLDSFDDDVRLDNFNVAESNSLWDILVSSDSISGCCFEVRSKLVLPSHTVWERSFPAQSSLV